MRVVDQQTSKINATCPIHDGGTIPYIYFVILFDIYKFIQECLRNFVINSATSYSNLIEQPCISLKDIEDNFTWSTDLMIFDDSSIPPLFSIMLNMNQNGPFYSNDPDKFEVSNILYFK